MYIPVVVFVITSKTEKKLFLFTIKMLKQIALNVKNRFYNVLLDHTVYLLNDFKRCIVLLIIYISQKIL